jgi:hypothetical protein
VVPGALAYDEVGGGSRQECRTYGARTFEDGDPALTRWANLCRASGAW